MTLKEARKLFQGKYFKAGFYYYKFIRVFKEDNTDFYSINVECVNSWSNVIDNNTVVFIYGDEVPPLYKKITKSEYIKYRNKALEFKRKPIITSTLPASEYFTSFDDLNNEIQIDFDHEIITDPYTEENFIYYHPTKESFMVYNPDLTAIDTFGDFYIK